MTAVASEMATVAISRVDWRFLVEHPDFERVGIAGSGDPTLAAALRGIGAAVDQVPTDALPPTASAPYAVVVACDPTDRDLVRGAAWVRLGGHFVIELGGPLRGTRGQATTPGRERGAPRLRRAAVGRRLGELGFEVGEGFWHWPSFERCALLIPLGKRVATRFAVGRAGSSRRARIWIRAAQFLLAMGRVEWMTSSVSVIARRRAGHGLSKESDPILAEPRTDAGGAIAMSSTAVHAVLRHVTPAGFERVEADSFVVLTPRFLNSSNLVFLFLDAAGSPNLVAKIARRRGPAAKLEREADRLREIQGLRPGGFDSIPRFVALESHDDHRILVQSALRGQAMDPALVRRRWRFCCKAMESWLIGIQSPNRGEASSPAHPLSVERDLQRLEAMLPEERALIVATSAILVRLKSTPLPRVLEHGDLSHPNVLIDFEGCVAAVDWEEADLCGLPAVDLFFFLAYVARARARATTATAMVAAVERAFFGPRSWVWAYWTRYARQLSIADEAFTPLYVACWVRQVAGLERRTAAGDFASNAARRIEWLRRDWRFELWRRAVAREMR